MSPTAQRGEDPVLAVRELSLSARRTTGEVMELLDSVTWSLNSGEALGVVGESGSGKSLTSLSILRLLPRNIGIDRGEVLLNGGNLFDLSDREMRNVRGKRIAMVLQDPMTSLDPSFTIGNQLGEAVRLHRGSTGAEVKNQCLELLRMVRIRDPEQRLRQYPHELSGGLRQRVTSAIALAGEPDVLIADEPTTALDVTTQAEYLTMLRNLQATVGFALVLISHDLFVVRQMCSRLVVMYAGQVVEEGSLDDLLERPLHPYTRALFQAAPKVGEAEPPKPIPGQSPDPMHVPQGCRYAPRCAFARDECVSGQPELLERSDGHRRARCFGTEPNGWIA